MQSIINDQFNKVAELQGVIAVYRATILLYVYCTFLCKNPSCHLEKSKIIVKIKIADNEGWYKHKKMQIIQKGLVRLNYWPANLDITFTDTVEDHPGLSGISFYQLTNSLPALPNFITFICQEVMKTLKWVSFRPFEVLDLVKRVKVTEVLCQSCHNAIGFDTYVEGRQK